MPDVLDFAKQKLATHPSPFLEDNTRDIRADLRLLEFAIVGILSEDYGIVSSDETMKAVVESFKAGCDDVLRRTYARLDEIEECAQRLRKYGVEPIPREFWKQCGIEDENQEEGGAR